MYGLQGPYDRSLLVGFRGGCIIANHTCNANMVTNTKDLIRVEPGGKKTYQLGETKTCDICGKLASKVNQGTVEE